MLMININISILPHFRIVELFLFSAILLTFTGFANSQHIQAPQLKFASSNTELCEGSELVVYVSNLPASSDNSIYWTVPKDWLVNGENIQGIDFENDTLVILTVGATSGTVSAIATNSNGSQELASASFTVIPASIFEMDAPEEACENKEIVISCSGPAAYSLPTSWQITESVPTSVKAIPYGGGKVKAVSTGLCHFADSATIIENKAEAITPINKTIETIGMADFSVVGPEDDHYTWYPYPGGRPFANYGGGDPYNTSEYFGYVEDSVTIYAVYTNAMGCESQPVAVTVEVANQRSLLITENQAQQDIRVSVGPNPFTENFTMEFSDQNHHNFQVSNTTGQVVYSGITDKNQYEFGQNLSSGIYYLTVLDGIRFQTIKLIKQ